MAKRKSLLLCAALVALGASTACNETPLPGTLLGMYKASGTVQANTCGDGPGAPNPWTFDVQLSESGSTAGSTLYWSWMDGSPPLTGTLTTASAAAFTNSFGSNVDGFDGGYGPCTMLRYDTLNVTLGAGTPTGSIAATISYAFSAQAGSDCSDQLVAGGVRVARAPWHLDRRLDRAPARRRRCQVFRRVRHALGVDREEARARS